MTSTDTVEPAPAYRLTGVTKTYRAKGRIVHALTGVDVEIATGDFVAILGPTGGGKSTLLQLLGALDTPTDGHVLLDGTDLAAARPGALGAVRAAEIGCVCQGFNLMPTRPGVLLADEPTGNLDESMRDEILTVLEQLNAEGLTLVVVTHDSAVARRARRRLRLDRGTLTDITR